MNVSFFRTVAGGLAVLVVVISLAACATPVSQAQPQSTVTINPSFQTRLSPIATVPPYRCGAWTSNNAPNANEKITIYARLTHSLKGVSGASATAVVHFRGGRSEERRVGKGVG